jgi:hypothetical protein
MSWIPSFLNPWLAAAAAAVAIPSLLILYFLKLRRKEVQIPSTLLWKKAVMDLQVNSPFQKLRRNLLLLLQLLILLALILAYSRPVSSAAPVAGEKTVLLIDRSASMSATDMDGGKSRLDEAKARAKKLVDTMPRNGRAMVIEFDDAARLVQPMTTDRSALRTAIDNIKPSDRPTKLQTAYQLADAQMQVAGEDMRAGATPTDVVVYSDGKVADAAGLSSRGRVRFDKIGTENAKNIGIVALSARRNYERPTEVQIFARLNNFGPEVVESAVSVSVAMIDPAKPGDLEFINQQPATVRLLPARWDEAKRREAEKAGTIGRDSVELTVELTSAAVIRARVTNTDGDALKADNEAYIVVPPAKSLSVALVTDGNVFLEKLVNSLNLDKPAIIPTAKYDQELPGDYDVVIFDRHSPPKLPPAGNFIYYGAVPPDTKLKAAKDAEGRVQYMENVSVLDWQRDHPMLRHLSLRQLFAANAMRLELPLEAQTLVEGNKGAMVVLYREGRGTHLVITFDALDSNWPLRTSWPHFMYNALQYMAVGSDLQLRQSLVPGATPTLARSNLDRANVPPTGLKLITPAETKTLPLPAQGELALPPLEQVGLYRTQPAVPQFEQVAVNLCDPLESDLVPAAGVPGGVGEEIAAEGGAANRSEWWWWLVAAVALPVLLVEWFVYTRRVHA